MLLKSIDRFLYDRNFPVGNYMFKVYNRNTKTSFSVSIVNFEQVNTDWAPS